MPVPRNLSFTVLPAGGLPGSLITPRRRGGNAAPKALHECDPHFLSRERKRASPVQKKGVSHCKRAARRAAMLAESGTYQAVYLNDLTIFYLRCRFACNSLPLRNLRLLWICADLLLPAKAALLGLAAICALSIAGDYTAPKQDSRAAADDRSTLSRIAGINAALPRAGITFRRQKTCASPRLPIKTLSLGGCKGGYSISSERE